MSNVYILLTTMIIKSKVNKSIFSPTKIGDLVHASLALSRKI